MKKMSRISMVAVLGLFLLSGNAMAVPILDFGVISPTPGSISYAGGTAPLVGTNIQVDNVVGLGGTSLHNNVALPLLNSTLNFTTGPTDGVWNWDGVAGSTIVIAGTIDVNSNGIVDAGDITGNLLLGQFGRAGVTAIGNNIYITGSLFYDQKNPDLLAYYGFSSQNFSGNFNISFSTPTVVTDGSAFTSDIVLSGDVINTPIPEPLSLLLLGLGLVGLAGIRRKFKS